MSRVLTDVEGQEAFESWLRSFLPQLFDEEFVLEPGTMYKLDKNPVCTSMSHFYSCLKSRNKSGYEG